MTCTLLATWLLEHIVVSTVNHFEDHQILTSSQHGSRRGNRVLEFVEELSSNMKSGKQTDVLN